MGIMRQIAITRPMEATTDWHARLKALGPGILLASAAVGGSHIVASTQAGAIYS